MSRREAIASAKKPPRDRTHKPKPRNAYMTIDPRVVPALLACWRPRGWVLEPACGKGDMVNALKRGGCTDIAWADIKDYGYPDTIKKDFLATTRDAWLGGEFSVITNPPNDRADDFIRHALDLTRGDQGCVAMFQRHEFDTAQEKRGDLFHHAAFAMKIVLPFRPYWFKRKKGEASNPFHRWAWYIWDWRNSGRPIIRYAP